MKSKAPKKQIPAKKPARVTTVSVAEAAEMASVVERTIRLACQEGRLQAEKVNGKWRIEKKAVREYIRRLKAEISAKAKAAKMKDKPHKTKKAGKAAKKASGKAAKKPATRRGREN